MTDADHDDPTRMREQPQLTTASGTLWVVVGGVSAALFVAMFLILWASLGVGIAVAGAVSVAVLCVGMIVVRAFVPPGRARLTLLAADFATLLLVAAVFALLVLAGQ